MADEKFLDLNGLTRYDTKIKEYIATQSVTYKPFPSTFPTTGTTQNFVNTLKSLDLPEGNVYMGAATLSDFPSGISNAEIEVIVYPSTLPNTKVIYCILRSANVAPYLWTCNSFSFNGWQPMGGGGDTFYLGDVGDYNTNNRLDLTDMEPGTYFMGFSNGNQNTPLYVKATINGQVVTADLGFQFTYEPKYALIAIRTKVSTITPTSGGVVFGSTWGETWSEAHKKIEYRGTTLTVKLNGGVPAISNSQGFYSIFNLLTTDGAQTVTGKKTFNTLPESSVVPTTDNQLVNKKYVDDNAGMPKFNYDDNDPDQDLMDMLEDCITNQEDPGMFQSDIFTVYDEDVQPLAIRELGFGTLLMKYDSTDQNIKGTFYGNGGSCTFDLDVEEDQNSNEKYLAMSNYYNLADSIGDITAVLETLTTPTEIETELSEI